MAAGNPMAVRVKAFPLPKFDGVRLRPLVQDLDMSPFVRDVVLPGSLLSDLLPGNLLPLETLPVEVLPEESADTVVDGYLGVLDGQMMAPLSPEGGSTIPGMWKHGSSNPTKNAITSIPELDPTLVSALQSMIEEPLPWRQMVPMSAAVLHMLLWSGTVVKIALASTKDFELVYNNDEGPRRLSWRKALGEGAPLDEKHFERAAANIRRGEHGNLNLGIQNFHRMLGEEIVAQGAVDPGLSAIEKRQLLSFLVDYPVIGTPHIGRVLGIGGLAVPGSSFSESQLQSLRALIKILPEVLAEQRERIKHDLTHVVFAVSDAEGSAVVEKKPERSVSELQELFRLWRAMLTAGKRVRLDAYVRNQHEGDVTGFVRNFLQTLELGPLSKGLIGPPTRELFFHALDYFLGSRSPSLQRLQLFRGFYFLGQQVAKAIANNNRNITFWLIDNVLIPWMKEGKIPAQGIVWTMITRMRDAFERIQVGRFLSREVAYNFALELYAKDPLVEYVVTKWSGYFYVWRGGPKSTLIRGERVMQVHPYGFSSTPSIGDVFYADVGTRESITSQRKGTINETFYIKVHKKTAWADMIRRHRGKIIENNEGFFIYPDITTGKGKIIGRLFVPLQVMREAAQSKGWQGHEGSLRTVEMTPVGLQNGAKRTVPYSVRKVVYRDKTYMVVSLSTNSDYPPILFEGDVKQLIRFSDIGLTQESYDRHGIAMILPWEDAWLHNKPDFKHIPKPEVTNELMSVENNSGSNLVIKVIGNLTQAATTIMSHDYVVRHGDPTPTKLKSWNAQLKRAATKAVTVLDFIVGLDPVAREEYVARLNMQWGDHIPALPTILETIGQLTDRHFEANINGGQRLHDITEKEQ